MCLYFFSLFLGWVNVLCGIWQEWCIMCVFMILIHFFMRINGEECLDQCLDQSVIIQYHDKMNEGVKSWRLYYCISGFTVILDMFLRMFSLAVIPRTGKTFSSNNPEIIWFSSMMIKPNTIYFYTCSAADVQTRVCSQISHTWEESQLFSLSEKEKGVCWFAARGRLCLCRLLLPKKPWLVFFKSLWVYL